MQYNTTKYIDENQDNETLKDRFCCKVKNIANH
ncbi:putative replication initiation protein Rep domain protein [Staphylococcus aureus]|nr:putative replication initiation protein Rep domain protein [Staphylococcus aureus]